MVGILGWLLAGLVSVCAAVLFVPRELWKRWRGRIVDRIDAALRRKVSRFDRRYREFLLGSLRFIDLKGLATVGFHTPELDEVFVDVSLAYRAPQQVPESVLARLPANATERHSIGDFLDGPQAVVLAVIGAAGSGKTTLLRHTARMIAQEGRGRRRTVPILLHLRNHAAAIVADPYVTVPDLLRSTLGRHARDEPPGWFEKKLRDGDCVVLLDGLDEVASPDGRRRVAGWVEYQTNQYPKNDYVITSRPRGYRTTAVEGALVLQVCDFTDEQVRRFVRGWYRAIGKHGTHISDDSVSSPIDPSANDLLERLDRAPELYELTRNPLLLTMIANVHLHCRALPGSRSELYGEICRVMLWQRREAMSLSTVVSGDKKEELLRRVAFSMMRRRITGLSRLEVLEELKPALRRLPTPVSADDFLADVITNGILIERDNDLYSFAHHTFQEYLAAAHVRDNGLTGILADSVDDDWWRETTLLYAARANAEQIVEACLRSGSVNALSLAFDCDEQGSALSANTRERLNELLEARPGEFERRRLMTSVLLTRHLRHAIRTADGGRICTRPITNTLYRLYLQDTGSNPPSEFSGIGTDPVLGVSGGEATAFIAWANDLTNRKPGYRFPRQAEINDVAVLRALNTTSARAAWLEPNDGFGSPELWTPREQTHPNAVDAATIARYVAEDIKRSTPTIARLVVLGLLIAVRDSDLIPSFALERILTHDLALTRELALPRDPNLDQALNLDRGAHLTLDDSLIVALTRNLARGRALTYVLALDNDHALTKALARDPELGDALARTQVRDSSQLMGVALARAVTRVLHRGTAATWTDEFARALIDPMRVHPARVISPDELANIVRMPLLDSGEHADNAASAWSVPVARRLKEAALPLVVRHRAVTTDAATAVRLAALCLAAEADAMGLPAVGESYRYIAAGITLLRMRAEGQRLASEMIILATA